jgi:hypothetical protein
MKGRDRGNAGKGPRQPAGMDRRDFLKRAALVAGGVAAGGGIEAHAANRRGVSIVLPTDDALGRNPVARWGVSELHDALLARGVDARMAESLEGAPRGDLRVLCAGAESAAARTALSRVRVSAPAGPEELLIAEVSGREGDYLLACGHDGRGLCHAVLELADRVRHGATPLAGLKQAHPLPEKAGCKIRSAARSFVSDVEDKPWFNDRDGWQDYLTMLATHRFSRVSLMLGIGYNTARAVTDSYFLFSYPFFTAVPGYDVRAEGVADDERDQNLATLRFVSGEAAKRGLEFQLGLWTHSYDWADSPKVNHAIRGLTQETHAPYCRDALTALLTACPSITGLTLRVHGESGVPDGSFTFWEMLFEGVKRCGRRVELDLHAKGVPEKTIDLALATGMPVNLSPKFWGEHMGLPYHQAAIRELEMSPEGEVREEATGVGAGSRKFTRYGYADLITEDRRYGILHRIWPGTRRALMWADPATSAGYGPAAGFCGSAGMELMEPLSFKGRKGSGLPGGRCAYADASLAPRRDWEKFRYTYRVWGRLLFNPDTPPEVWRRGMARELGDDSPGTEMALACASRVLPLITTAHGASANNMIYWPEIYTNMPIVDPGREHPYTDTPAPKRFGTVSPFDPQLFAGVDECADALMAGTALPKYSPLEVADWLEDLSRAAEEGMARAEKRTGAGDDAALRRVRADIAIQSGLGRFFASKLRAAVYWRLGEQTGASAALDEAIKAYSAARAAWEQVAQGPARVYAADITYGPPAHLRGHWSDRLEAIDSDIADMQARRKKVSASQAAEGQPGVLQKALARRPRTETGCHHAQPSHFGPGEPLEIAIECRNRAVTGIRLAYRHVTQAERWQMTPMDARTGGYSVTLSAEFTRSRHPLQYYFVVDTQQDGILLFPGFNRDLSNQPYFVVRRNV